MAEEEEKKPEGGEPRTPTERTDSPQSPREPGGRSDKPTPKPEPGQKPEVPKGGKTSKDVPGAKIPGAGEGKIPGAEGAKAPGGVPAPPAGIPTPKLPKGPEKDEEGKRRPPLGETPLEAGGKVAKKGGEALETAGKAGGEVGKAVGAIPTPVTKAAGTAIEGASKAAKYTGKGAKEIGRRAEELGKKAAEEEKTDEGEEDLEATAKAAAAKGKKRLKWLKWPAIFGCLGCGGCTGLIVTILLPILIVVVIIGGGDLGEGFRKIQGTTGIYLSQLDSRWKDTVVCGDWRIGQAGCVITSAAMNLRYFGADVTPVDIADVTCDARGQATQNFNGTAREAVANKYNMQYVNIGTSVETLKQTVQGGTPVVAYSNSGLCILSGYESSPHAVLVVGISGDQMTIMDPSDPNGINASGQDITRTTPISSWSNSAIEAFYFKPR